MRAPTVHTLLNFQSEYRHIKKLDSSRTSMQTYRFSSKSLQSEIIRRYPPLSQLSPDLLRHHSDVLMSELHPEVIILVQQHLLHALALAGLVLVDVVLDGQQVIRHRLQGQLVKQWRDGVEAPVQDQQLGARLREGGGGFGQVGSANSCNWRLGRKLLIDPFMIMLWTSVVS